MAVRDGRRRGALLEAALAELDQRTLERLGRAAGGALAPPPRRLPGTRGRLRASAAGIELEELSGFVAGDEARMVDWRASARARRIQVRRFREERTADWYLLLDCSSSMVTPGTGKWLRAAQVCLALAYLALRRGDRAALVMVGERLLGLCPPGRGAPHYAALVSTLRRHPPPVPGERRGTRPAEALAVIRAPATVVLAGDALRPDGLRPDLARLAAAADHLRVVQVLDEDETALPAGTLPLELEDAEDGTRRPVGPSQSARKGLERYNRDLARWCRSRGILLTRHSASEAFTTIVLDHVKGRPAARG